MRLLLRVCTAAALVTAIANSATAQRQSDSTFRWSGRIPAGEWIRIRNLNGPITVSPASGSDVEVVAVKEWHRGDPADVRIETHQFGADGKSMLICALWGQNSSCDEHGYDSHGDHGVRNNDVSVRFEVHVPKGVRVGVNTVNGAVRVDGATSDVDAGTVNGELDVATTGGHVDASNVNGSVRARLGHIASGGDMQFTTVNGGIELDVPSDFGADVEMSTVNGSLDTDFPLTIHGRMNPRNLTAHIGRPGGPHIRLTTVNGRIQLRKE